VKRNHDDDDDHDHGIPDDDLADRVADGRAPIGFDEPRIFLSLFG
jgi:hypothetical protein